LSIRSFYTAAITDEGGHTVMTDQSPKSTHFDDLKNVLGERLLTVGEVSQVFSVKPTTVREWIKDGELVAIRLGKEYRVSETAIREYKDEREREQRILSEQRRAERARSQALRHRQEVDPAAEWEIAQCIFCGIEPTFSDRFQRDSGDVICQSCQDKLVEKGPDKVAWKRKVEVIIRERERQAAKKLDWEAAEERAQLLAAGRKPPALWLSYECGWCGKPTPISRREVLDGRTIPNCNHEPPFGSGQGVALADEIATRQYDTMILAPLAELEAVERVCMADLTPDEWWPVCRCAHCGERRAVEEDHKKQLIGKTACRLCHQRGLGIDLHHQARVVAEARPIFHTIPCSCGCSRELVTRESAPQVVLSWCEKRPLIERRHLAEQYGELVSLPPHRLNELIGDVVFPGLPF
jgi:excisionase family DNA binding protein